MKEIYLWEQARTHTSSGDSMGEKNHYFQFDGAPISRGVGVLGPVRSLLLGNRREQIKDALRKFTLINRSESDPNLSKSFYTEAPLTMDGRIS